MSWMPNRDKDGQYRIKTEAFSAKSVTLNGIEYKLFKRIVGNEYTAAANTETDLDFTVPYPIAKIESIEIINGAVGDKVTFEVRLAANNALLNTFGNSVFLDASGYYEQHSQYDADVSNAVKFRLKFTNSGAQKQVYVNYVLNELKV